MVFTVGGDWIVWTLLFFRIHIRVVERLLVRSLHFNACTLLMHLEVWSGVYSGVTGACGLGSSSEFI